MVKKPENPELDLTKAELNRAEAKERLSGIEYDKEDILIRKVSMLSELLSENKPGEKLLESSETNWVPVITDEYELKVIHNKIIELVKKF